MEQRAAEMVAQAELNTFLLEIVFANVALATPTSEWKLMTASLMKKIRFDAKATEAEDHESASQVHQALIRQAERFFARASERAAADRAERTQTNKEKSP